MQPNVDPWVYSAFFFVGALITGLHAYTLYPAKSAKTGLDELSGFLGTTRFGAIDLNALAGRQA